MRPCSFSQPALPVAWAQLLDNLDEILRKTAAAAAEREQAIVSPSSNSEHDRMIGWQHVLQQIQQQRRGWPTVFQQAEEEASEAAATVNAAQEALRRWLHEALALERRLAKWVEPEV